MRVLTQEWSALAGGGESETHSFFVSLAHASWQAAVAESQPQPQ